MIIVSHIRKLFPFIQNNSLSSVQFARNSASQRTGIVKNESIKFPELRVIYEDGGGNKWAIMSRREALLFAQQRRTDLVLVSSSSAPPVCRLIDAKKYVIDRMKKEKETPRHKQKLMKEVVCNGGIHTRDLEMKMDQARRFLAAKHQVKIVITMRYVAFRKAPLALDKTVLELLDFIENDVVSINYPEVNNLLRRELILTPKAQ
jgi:translation initiation factor IF-3